ncbi:AAA domain-containing protein [Mariniphaga anaerophila]|uniref:AAA domain-containing protein n=1 Tax=Mariniphaga anaerophila TaxID=1484053 RepID=A0A1M5CF27_9BACT|nr:AAA family ATPase [Mariniphaga anaerophila]SHF53207.1 AAA domain-containing protein [Mariniphaga anaerophila]
MNQEEIKKIIEGSLLKADHEFENPPICLEIMGDYGNQIFSTLGNFSTILARPKVGKTTFSAILVSSLLSAKTHLKFAPNLPDKRKKIIWIDTEQGTSECVRTLRFISKKVTGNEKKHPENLYFLSLRKYGPQQRSIITEYAINFLKDASFVVIDGIRDFATSINDEKEATAITDKLLKWTQEKNIHILTILHQNKGDSNARGHLGTELMNKAETVAKLSREEPNGTRVTIVEPEFTRHRDFEKFAYSLNDNGDLIEENAVQGYQPQNPKVDELTVYQLEETIRKTFNGTGSLTYGNLWQGLKSSLKTIDIKFGDNKCKELVTSLQNRKFLNYNENSKSYSPNIPKV